MAVSSPTEPLCRHSHFSGATLRNLVVYGGRLDGKEELTIHTFNSDLESWSSKATSSGEQPPPGLYLGASCTSVNNEVYLYGGCIGRSDYYGSLYKFLDFHWSLLSTTTAQNAPQAKAGCQMLHYGSILLIFGGYRDDDVIHPQPGATYEKDSDGDIVNNELHIFNCLEGTWSSPTVTGTRPPFCWGFTLTMVEEDKAILFGGCGSDEQRCKHVYMFDFKRMHWSKLDDDKGDPWPKGKSRHAAVCLGFGGDHPQLLITGGWKGGSALDDAWTLDIKSWRWREVKGLGIQRWGHSTTGFTINQDITEVVVFGGRDGWNTTLADTMVLRFECQECPFSDGPPTVEWVLTDIAEGHQLGTEQRVREKEVLFGVQSLKERSIAVIVSSLLQQKLKPDELDARLSDYVPRILRNAITDKYKSYYTLLIQF